MDWKNICAFMKYAKTTDEKAYQDSLKEILLENCLGWNSTEIAEQHSITLGSTQRLIPDLIVSKNGVVQFIIEVKQPFHTRRHEDIEQLASYMKQLEINTGIYIGSNLEVYYKKIGDGSQPELILSTEFKPDNLNGEIFADTFSASSFSLEKIDSLYKQHIKSKMIEEQTREITDQLCSPETIDLVKLLLADYLESEDKSAEAIENALKCISISIHPAKKFIQANQCHSDKLAPTHAKSVSAPEKYGHTMPPRKIRNDGTARDVAFNIVSEIIRLNSNKTYSQLYNIFGRKTYIKALKDVNNPERWNMDKVFTSIDGTKFVISNQWGLKNGSKPKFDLLVHIAKSFGIEIIMPYAN